MGIYPIQNACPVLKTVESLLSLSSREENRSKGMQHFNVF